MNYKRTQINYLLLAFTMILLLFFMEAYISAQNEPPSYDSGPNLAITTVMVMIIIILASFISFQVAIDEKFLRIKFGYGIYKKNFLLNEIESVKPVRNKWYYGWGITILFWPGMCIYSTSGLNAVEIKLKNGKTYRIGTKEPKELAQIISESIK